jgi:hypothetical protein
MVGCLAQGGVPAMVVPTGEDSATIIITESERPWVMSLNGFTSMSPAEATQAELEAANAVAAAAWAQIGDNQLGVAPSYLVWDGADRTELLLDCLAETGFTPSFPEPDREQESREKIQRAAAGADWARCAREHGFPQINDPAAPVVDGYQTMPDVLIPDTISEEQLRELLTVCPEVSAEQRRLQAEADVGELTDQEYAELFLRVPSLMITSQCLDVGSQCSNQQLDRLDALQVILAEHEDAAG